LAFVYLRLPAYLYANPPHLPGRGEVSNGKGIVYMQLGGEGGNLEDNAPNSTWFASKNYRGHHYSTVQLVGDKLELRTYDLAVSIIDVYGLRK